MDFWNHSPVMGGGWLFIRYSSFLLYRNCKRLREFEEMEISRQSCTVEVTVNSKEESSSDFFLDFVQEFGLRKWARWVPPPPTPEIRTLKLFVLYRSKTAPPPHHYHCTKMIVHKLIMSVYRQWIRLYVHCEAYWPMHIFQSLNFFLAPFSLVSFFSISCSTCTHTKCMYIYTVFYVSFYNINLSFCGAIETISFAMIHIFLNFQWLKPCDDKFL